MSQVGAAEGTKTPVGKLVLEFESKILLKVPMQTASAFTLGRDGETHPEERKPGQRGAAPL